jgi:YVTN family beta-propeller protein
MKFTSLIIATTFFLGACSAATGGSGSAPVPATGAIVYVCNQDDATVTLIDSGTNEIIETVDLKRLGFGPNAKPHHVVVEPDGSYWYVSLIGENRVVKLDRSNRVVGVAEFDVPGMLALHPTDDVLLVGRSMTAVNPPERIGVIERSTMETEELPVFFPRPHAIGLSPTADVGYTASLAVNQLAAVDYAEEEVNLVPVPGESAALMQFALSPDGRTLVITGEVSGELLVFDVSDPMRPQLTDRIEAGVQPFDPIFTRDGRWVYFGNKLADRVTVVDMRTREVAATIEHDGIRQPHGVAITPDGRYIYVSNNNLGAEAHRMMSADHAAHAGPQAQGEPGLGTVVVIDTATRAVVDVITVGRNASGIAIAQGRAN